MSSGLLEVAAICTDALETTAVDEEEPELILSLSSIDPNVEERRFS